MRRAIAILGAGNGGQAFAAYFKFHGHQVRLYDAFSETVVAINKKGFIELTGALNEKIEFHDASVDMARVIDGAEVIIVINPSTHHRKIAAKLAKCLKPNQLIFINPGATFGSFAMKRALADYGYTDDVVIAESNVLLFACRMREIGTVFIGAKKDRILVSAFPAIHLDKIKGLITDIIPEAQFVSSVIATAIDNTNPTVHPLPAILNVGWIESGEQFSFMQKAVSPTLGRYMELMDRERIAVGEKLGLVRNVELFDLYQQYEAEYGVYGKQTLCDVFRACDAYTHIYAPTDLYTARYITEDVGMGLVPLVDVGRQIGVDVSKSKLIVDVCEAVLGLDLTHGEHCRNAESLGLAGMSAEQIIRYAQTGER